MNRSIAVNRLKPIIDRVLAFDAASANPLDAGLMKGKPHSFRDHVAGSDESAMEELAGNHS